MFNHVRPVELVELEADTTENGRFYTTPDGVFPSVTTVLSHYKKNVLENWKAKVGEEKANQISTQASIRGEAVHLLAENYLKNDPFYTKGHMPANVFTFNSIKPILDKSVNNIHYLEAPLYSKFLGVAGRVDCIAEYDGVLSIIDFKTSKKRKKPEWIDNYFMQESAYAVMYEERTKIPVKQLVTIIAVDDDEPQVFVQDRDDWIQSFMTIAKNYDKNNSNN